MKVYIREWARPCGAEPKIFYSFEEAEIKCDCKYDPDHDLWGCSPWCGPEVREFDSEFEARKWLKEYYPTSYEELRGKK